MKRLPASLLLLASFTSFLFVFPLAPNLHAEESAAQLADQTLGPDSDQPDESAEDLAKERGLAIQPGVDSGPSAEDLAKQDGLETPDGADPEESARQLAEERGLETAGPGATPESASKLAEQDGLEHPSKKATSPSASVLAAGEGVNGPIYAVAALPDGGVIIGGRFTAVNGQPRANLARIEPDGTLDPAYLAAPTDGVSGAVYALALDANGNLLVGGFFTTAQGQPLQNFARYLANGTLDAGFASSQGPNGPVYALAVQADGAVAIGGQFSLAGSQPRKNLARYSADGTLAPALTAANGSAGTVRSLAVLANGTILAGGSFTIPGQSAPNLLRAR